MATVTDPEAPYGRKTNGEPRKRPGRPSNGGAPAISAEEAASLLPRIAAECDAELARIDAQLEQLRAERAEVERVRAAIR